MLRSGKEIGAGFEGHANARFKPLSERLSSHLLARLPEDPEPEAPATLLLKDAPKPQ